MFTLSDVLTPPRTDAPAAPTTSIAAAVYRMVPHLASPTPHATALVQRLSDVQTANKPQKATGKQ
jgi:hypothetical protein